MLKFLLNNEHMTFQEIMDSGKVFKVLNENESKAIKLRYGFEDGKMRTLAETAKIMDLSRERVRQLESQAKNKIIIVLEYENKEKL